MKKLNFDKLKLAEASKTLRSIKRDRFISIINNNETIKKKFKHLAEVSEIMTIRKVKDSRNNYPVLVKEKPQPVKPTQKENFYDWMVKMGNIYLADRQRMDVALDSIIEY